MAFTQNDVATCVSNLVQEFNDDLQLRLRVVSALSRLVGKLDVPEYADFGVRDNIHNEIWKYCKENFEEIVQVYPDLKDAVTEYLKENPHNAEFELGYCEAFFVFELTQKDKFRKILTAFIDNLA